MARPQKKRRDFIIDERNARIWTPLHFRFRAIFDLVSRKSLPSGQSHVKGDKDEARQASGQKKNGVAFRDRRESRRRRGKKRVYFSSSLFFLGSAEEKVDAGREEREEEKKRRKKE